MRSLGLWQRYEYTTMKPGLDRIKSFLNDCGNPQNSFKAVHVAGTNGKGSTAMMISKVLESAGYKTGLYVSPHLVRLTERIRVNSREINNVLLDKLARKYDRLAKTHRLSFFEFITALAYIYFAEKEVDVAVLETGLGGRFDATNVIERPLVSVITDIGYDHTEILGKTISLIAKEKAGIIKYRCPVVSGAQDPMASRVIRNAARTKNCILLEAGRDFEYRYFRTDWNCTTQTLDFLRKGKKTRLVLPLLGEYQQKNCSLAVACAQLIREQGFSLPDSAIKKGIAKSIWPGRFDVRKIRIAGRIITLVLDGAHNPQAMGRFLSSFKKSIWYKRKYDIVFGVLKDKDYRSIVKLISGLGKKLVLVPVKSARTFSEKDLLKIFRKTGRTKRIITAASLAAGIKNTDSEVIVITGSLYLVGESLKLLNSKYT